MPRPTQQKIDAALELISRGSSNYAYFFDQLNDPDWLIPLRDAGLFDVPLPPDTNEVGTRFPKWAASEYLVRIAPKSPALVMETILRSSDTENIRVHEDYVTAAIEMPANVSSGLVTKVEKWLLSGYKLRLTELVAKLVAHLITNGELEAGVKLAKSLLRVASIKEMAGAETGEDESYFPPPESIGSMSEYDYEECLSMITPAFIAIDSVRGYMVYRDLLRRSVSLSVLKSEGEHREDYSYIWRNVVSEDEGNLTNRFSNLLVTHLLRVLLQIGQTDPAKLSIVIRELFEEKWPMFWRIGLHLLARFPNNNREEIALRLTDRTLFESPSARREYYALSEAEFRNLDIETKCKILDWIDVGTAPSIYRRAFPQASEREIEKMRLIEQRDRLAPLVDGLPAEWQSRWEMLTKEFGPPAMADRVFESGATWIGPSSPKTSTELLEMPGPKLLEFLLNWEPNQNLREDSPEGLGRILAEAVKTNPEHFSSIAVKLSEVNPTYVRAFLSGTREAYEGGKTIDWEAVVSLALEAIQKPRSISKNLVPLFDSDPDWGWVRREIGNLLDQGLRKKDSNIPLRLRGHVWTIIKILLEDEDPTPETEESFGGGNLDSFTLSINSVRGYAMHATFRYLAWLNNYSITDPNLIAELEPLRLLAERALDRHLDITIEPSPAVRSVYGLWFPNMYVIDSAWTKRSVDKIFSLAPLEQKYFLAAWAAYLRYAQPYTELLGLLRDRYLFAVESLSRHQKNNSPFHDSDEKLAEHIIVYYIRGNIRIDDPLLVQFRNKASDELLDRSVHFIGMILHKSVEALPQEVLERVKDLFENLLQKARSSGSVRDLKPLQEFGWVFISDVLETRWALEFLGLDLSVTKGLIEMNTEVIDSLAKKVNEFPDLVLDCLRKIVEGEDEYWSLSLASSSMRTILERILVNPDRELVRKAKLLVDYLGAKGFKNFRDLVQ